jgi:hypothetical protein
VCFTLIWFYLTQFTDKLVTAWSISSIIIELLYEQQYMNLSFEIYTNILIFIFTIVNFWIVLQYNSGKYLSIVSNFKNWVFKSHEVTTSLNDQCHLSNVYSVISCINLAV